MQLRVSRSNMLDRDDEQKKGGRSNPCGQVFQQRWRAEDPWLLDHGEAQIKGGEVIISFPRCYFRTCVS